MTMHKVLLADDEPVTRRVLAAMLQREGFDVTAVENGAEAIAMLAEQTFDLVITDRNMPAMDGVALMQHLQGAGGSRIPVIMITSSSAEAAESEAIGSGAQAFLTKPISSRELAATLDKILRR